MKEIHEGVALLLDAKGVMPTDESNRRLAVAICEVEKHYPIPYISPGRKALGLLAFTAFSVYRPVVTAILTGEPKAPEQAQAPAPVQPAPVMQHAVTGADWGFPAGNA